MAEASGSDEPGLSALRADISAVIAQEPEAGDVIEDEPLSEPSLRDTGDYTEAPEAHPLLFEMRLECNHGNREACHTLKQGAMRFILAGARVSACYQGSHKSTSPKSPPN